MSLTIRIMDMHAREILDSRGNPTVEAEVTVEKEVGGRQYVGRAATSQRCQLSSSHAPPVDRATT